MEKNTQAPLIRLSDLPDNYKASARNLVEQFDSNGDGCIDAAELALAVEALKNSRKKNHYLTKIVVGLTIASLLLIGSVFGVSVAAARMAKDTETDDDTGFFYNKGKKSVVKTGEAITWTTTDNLVDVDKEVFLGLKYFSMLDDDVRFDVKGHARAPSGEEVMLLVEGGTLTFKDTTGLTNATGDARFILETAGVDFGNSDISGRQLQGWGLMRLGGENDSE